MSKYLNKKHSVSSLFLTVILISAFIIIFSLLMILSQSQNPENKSLIISAITASVLILIIGVVILWPVKKAGTVSLSNRSINDHVTDSKLITDLQNEKKYFAGVLSHDLRSPLSSIILLTSYLKTKDGNSETSQYIELIEQSARKELEMMSTLLSLMRADVSKTENYEEVPLKNLTEEILQSAESKLSTKELKTSLTISPEIILQADHQALKSILKNLISQVICYSDRGQTIEITSSENEKQVIIELAFNSEELKKTIGMDLFNSDRLPSQMTINAFPECIDLYFTRKAISTYNGTIHVQCDVNGTTCRFLLTIERHPPQNIA